MAYSIDQKDIDEVLSALTMEEQSTARITTMVRGVTFYKISAILEQLEREGKVTNRTTGKWNYWRKK